MLVDVKKWLLIIAVGTFLVLVGAIVDLALRKKEVRKIHDWMYNFSVKISQVPLRRWQIIVAKFILGLLYYFGLSVNEAANGKNSLAVIYKNTDDINKNSVDIKRILFAVVRLFALLIPWPVIYYAFKNEWVLAILGVPVIITMFFILVMIYLELVHDRVIKWFDDWFRILLLSSLVSCVFNIIAFIIAIHMFPYGGDNYWFGLQETSQTQLTPKHPLLLSLINFPFDFLTLMITYIVLSRAVIRNGYFAIAALLDLISSLILAIFLYTTLKIVDGTYSIFLVADAFINSVYWAKQILFLFLQFLNSNIVFDAKEVKDITLVPLVLTTAVPVLFYVSIMLIISLLKPPFILAGRIFAAVSEKEESVFRQFAFVITLILAAMNAISDYFSYSAI